MSRERSKTNNPAVIKMSAKFWILNCSNTLEQVLEGSDIIVSVDPGIKNTSISILNKNLKLESYFRIALNKGPLIYQQLTEKLAVVTEEIGERMCCLLIEKQLPRGGILLRIQQHIIAFFMIKRPDIPIIEVDPKNRVSMLKQYYRKKRVTKRDSVSWVTELLQRNDDMKALHIIKSLKKKDDFADTVCQVYSLIPHFYE